MELLETHPGPLIVPTLVITEVVYLLATRLGTEPEVRFLGDLAAGAFTVEPVTPSDWIRIAELVARYHGLPLGTVDASVVAAAERQGLSEIATVDGRHFTLIRPHHIDVHAASLKNSPDRSSDQPGGRMGDADHRGTMTTRARLSLLLRGYTMEEKVSSSRDGGVGMDGTERREAASATQEAIESVARRPRGSKSDAVEGALARYLAAAQYHDLLGEQDTHRAGEPAEEPEE